MAVHMNGLDDVAHFLPASFEFFPSVIQMKVDKTDTVYFSWQPDLLNFKKGWMSKLDDSGEVSVSVCKHSY